MVLHPIYEFAKQPEGGIGMAMAGFMDQLNERVQNKALQMLRPFRARHVLEIGFGAGGLADKIYKEGMANRYVGVEISDTMVREFNRNYRLLNKMRKDSGDTFEAIHSSVELMPLRSEQFDVAIAMNTIYWWHNPLAGLCEIHRVLKPGGILLVGMVIKSDIQPIDEGLVDGPKHYSEVDLAKLVQAAKFSPTDIETFTDAVMNGEAGSRAYALALAEAL